MAPPTGSERRSPWTTTARRGSEPKPTAFIAAWQQHPPDPGAPLAGQTISELTIHTWDLARATGQDPGIA